MTAQVINLTDAIEARDQQRWDAAARSLGFKDYAALEAANLAEFESRFEWLQQRCVHADKHPELGMCETCASLLRA